MVIDSRTFDAALVACYNTPIRPRRKGNRVDDMHRIYVDHSATTPMSPQVIDAMAPIWTDVFANSESSHTEGQAAADILERVRQTVADLLSCHPTELVFTGSGTEADNLAQIRAALDGQFGRVYVFDRQSGSSLFEGSVDEVRCALDSKCVEDVCAKPREPSVP